LPEGGQTAQRTAEVRVLAPTQDTDGAALSAHLTTIAERALANPLEAEQLVDSVWRREPTLVVAATRSALASQRDAARAELERLVRRAALDALPPVIAKPTSDASGGHRTTGPAISKKIGKSAAGNGTGRASTSAAAAPPPAPAPTPPPHAAPAPAPTVAASSAPTAADAAAPTPRLATAHADSPAPQSAPSELQRRPPSRTSGLAGSPTTEETSVADQPRGPITAPRGNATAQAARSARRGGTLALSILAVAVLLGGLGYGYFAYAPEAPLDLERAEAPAQTPEPPPTATGSAAPIPEPPQTAALSADGLQLEAAEPTAGPLRERAELTEPADTPASPAPPVVTLGDDLRLILIHQNNSTAAANAEALEATLATLKDPVQMELRSVDFSIATPRIRYFYADDAASAAALADILGPPANGSGSWQVQDFTYFRPGPTEGTVEIFVPDNGS
jgi:hypothetical protein